jgi:hypothetical protein
MDEINPEQIQERLKELPEIIQEAINNSGWEEKIRRVASVFNLRVDQGAALEKLTQLTMLGFKDPTNFLNEVKDNVWVSEDEAKKITIEVREKIFDSIKSEIVKISRKEAGLLERTEIDEIIYGREEDSLDIYNINASLEDNIETEVNNVDDESVSREQIKEEIKNDVEIIEEEEEEKEVDVVDTIKTFNEKDSMSKKLEAPTTTITENTTLDPYRESLE